MIERIALQNFKCFADQTIVCAPLTLLVGANASGKSSVIQALLLLRQSQQAGKLQQGQLMLMGPLANIGTQIDLFYQRRNDETLAITIAEQGQASEYQFRFDSSHATDYIVRGAGPRQPPAGALFQPAFNYLNAERAGPQVLYQIGTESGWDYTVGIHGQYTVPILGRHRTLPVANPVGEEALADAQAPLAAADDSEGPIELNDQEAVPTEAAANPPPPLPTRTLEAEAVRWMQTIIPNFEFNAQVVEQTDQAVIRMRTESTLSYVRPTNIGFGLIYTLPIVVAALVAPPGSLLIVENPEAHLHPASQSAIGRFLAQVAAAGVQVIIETHSDHVLNGIRVAVRNKALTAEQVSIQYFVSANGDTAQQVITPRLYPSGGISPRPEGFFDQIDKDITELL